MRDNDILETRASNLCRQLWGNNDIIILSCVLLNCFRRLNATKQQLALSFLNDWSACTSVRNIRVHTHVSFCKFCTSKHFCRYLCKFSGVLRRKLSLVFFCISFLEYFCMTALVLMCMKSSGCFYTVSGVYLNISVRELSYNFSLEHFYTFACLHFYTFALEHSDISVLERFYIASLGHFYRTHVECFYRIAGELTCKSALEQTDKLVSGHSDNCDSCLWNIFSLEHWCNSEMEQRNRTVVECYHHSYSGYC